MRHRKRHNLLCFHNMRSFTLVEVLIALSITTISLVPLLHLLVVSISVVDSAGCLSRATLIGDAKLAEVINKGYPEIGTERGYIENEDSDVTYQWQVNVTDAFAKELEDIGLSGLRRVNVVVTWKEGQKQKQISMSTFVSIDQVVKETTLKGKSTPQ